LKNIAPFTVGSITKKLNRIRVQINTKYNRPFPKPRFFWLSEYTYKRRYIKIHSDGRILGGLSRFVSSLVDFSFLRSIVAHKYSFIGFAYDPVSLFMLELFRYLEKYPNMKNFLEVVYDREKGKHYRLYDLRVVDPTGRRPASTTQIYPVKPHSPISRTDWEKSFTTRFSMSS
jgi:hypothetical protein